MIAYDDPEEDKIDDANIETDENGIFKIFKKKDIIDTEL